MEIVPQIKKMLRQFDGPLTQELLLQLGKFGLGHLPAKSQPDATTTTVCGFCSTGCGLTVHLKGGEAINLTPSTHYPVNLGMACPKGWEALTPLAARDRATVPLLRDAEGTLHSVSWDMAMRTFAKSFKSIQARHGAESLAFLSTGQIVTEEMAFLGALAKFGMGMIHGDGNTRQCMATAATAYKESFGFDAPPFTYQDFEESDALIFIGANPCIAHPIMWQRVNRNPHHPEIIVVDPRKTETAMAATQHYAIKPKSDLIFLYGVAHALNAKGWIDREYIAAHTNGFEDFEKYVREFTSDRVVTECGISAGELERLVQTIHKSKRVSFWWTMGVNQSHEGTRTAQAIINLALMTGNMGRPGTGANSITGQCNAMGSRLFSNTTNLLGGRDFKNIEHRQIVAQRLGIEIERIPDRNSWAYDQIIEGIDQGKIKGLWVIATNTAHSWIDQNRLNKIFEKLEFLVVQDMYHSTETACRADLVLPAAGWGEKEGTFINSERRIGLAKKVSLAPEQALSDFSIFKLVAKYWGADQLFSAWDSPESVFQIVKKLSIGQPCDISGIIDYQMLDDSGGIQWPFPANARKGMTQRRLFEDGRYYHPDGRARFIYEPPRKPGEVPSDEYPFVLLTGRGTSSQWHTESRTRKSDILNKLCPEGIYIELNPTDATRLGIEPGQKIRVSSRRGELVGVVQITTTVAIGQIFIPMHSAATNQLTYSEVDPYSRQPSYKNSAVRVEKALNRERE